MSTKARIVETARQLFNERGYGAVTTAALAEECGISEGNLWYHFKTKRDLLGAIAQQLADHIDARLALIPDSRDPVGSYVVLLESLMEELRTYRFLYRDQPSYGEHVEPIASRVAEWLAKTQDSFHAHFSAMADRGALDWPTAQLRDLAANVTIILRYGLEHYNELGQPHAAVRKSLLRHLTLFENRLEPAAAARLHQAIERIDEEIAAAA